MTRTAARRTGERKAGRKAPPPRAPLRWLRRWLWRILGGLLAAMVLSVLLFRVVNPPTTPTIWAEGRRLGAVAHQWVAMEDIAPVARRATVAAEDADFCLHWGFDMSAIRAALADGAVRGASTISQQTVKNVWLWQGRSWPRKALEAVMTPMVEAAWPKRRILEVYLNVAEYDAGVFGIGAAAQHYFGVSPAGLSAVQAARLAAVLPAPKQRSAAAPSAFLRRRAAAIRDGAATIARDRRAACIED